jgi:probable rRNA maturation factor
VLEIRNLQRKESVDRVLVEQAVALALEAVKAAGRGVSLALVSDRAMSRLNRRFTGRPGPTDVLAFPLEEGDYLGEVIISTETCRRQAAERGSPFEEELALLVIHGVLHLGGHDHTLGSAEDRRQRALERKLVRKLKQGLGGDRGRVRQ